jgi:hypothetical protein
MIRSFDWRDVGLVKALAERGVCLDSETGLTQGTHPLQQALLAYLMPMAGPPTLIWRGDSAAAERGGDGAGRPRPSDKAATAAPAVVFGQLRHRLGEEHARILYVAPLAGDDGAGWLPLLERLIVEAGERRAQNLLAEVNEKSPEYDALREAGFAIYARQSLWKLAPSAGLAAAAGSAAVRAATRADAIPVNTLYSNIVPRLVQQVEPGPQHIERGYVLDHGGELVAYLNVHRGPQGIWVEPFLHPEAYDLSDAVLNACLQLVPSRKEKPLYICIRRYQDWLQEVVARAGFEALGSQAVMVKRLAVRLNEPLIKPLPVVDGQVPTAIPSAQFRRRDDEPRSANWSNAHPHYRWPNHAKTNYR